MSESPKTHANGKEFLRGLSRRRFLQQTSLALGSTCGVAPLFASLAASKDSPSHAASRLGRDFIYGTWFYSPQDIRPEQFRPLIADIANRYQFNLIRIFPPWEYYNPRPGEYRFDDLEQLLSVCDEFDVRVLMNVMLESAPYWLEEVHPEARFVDASGKARHLQGAGVHFTGGFPGLCFDWQPVRDAAATFMQQLVKLSARHGSLFAYDIWNEPDFVDLGAQEFDTNMPMAEKLFCYCEATLGEYRRWLKRRYVTLDRLNESWIRSYPEWEIIEPPRAAAGTSADWLDWSHFIQDRTTDYLKFRVSTVRALDRSHLIGAHAAYAPAVGPVTIRGIDNWRLAQEVDVYGCSFYPGGWGWSIDRAAAELEIIRSCAKGKDFWVTEMQGGSPGFGYVQSPPLRPRDIRTHHWLAVAAGAKGIVYYGYLSEGTGGEASHFGMVARNGVSTERVEEAAQLNRVTQARWELLKHHRPKPQVAILFDQDNPLLTFSASGKEDPSMQSFAGYYKAFWQLDLSADCIEAASIDHAQYKFLVAPWHLIAKKATSKKLQTFVEQGGTLLLETGFSRFDEKYWANAVVPGNGLDEAFGYREADSVMVENGKLPMQVLDQAPSGDHPLEALLEFSAPVQARVKAHTYLTPVELHSATPIATCRQWTVGAMKKLGAGKVYYIGTNLGASISGGDSGGIDLLRSMVLSLVKPPVSSSGALRPRLIQGAGRGLLTIFNATETDQAATISLTGEFRGATDAYSGKRYAISDNTFDISVPFKDVAALDLD